ncbi:MAG: ABC transporter substrate-binding protein [Bacteroidota bacterium]|nr:ABC transporter substrate-binding protein [Bacteroidota bacterium]
MKKIFILLVLILSISYWQCTKQSSEMTMIKLGYAPIADAAQIYVGIEKGYFAENRLKIQFEQLGSGAKILEAVGAGSVQIGLSSYVPLILARAAGVDLVAISGGAVEDSTHWEHAYVVKSDSKITSIKDIEDKTLALNGLRNIDHLLFQELMEKYNIDQTKIRLVEIPFPRMESVLQSGEVDIIAAIEPFVTRAISRGNYRVLTYNYLELYKKVPVACYVAKNKWIEENNDVLTRFINAFNKATEFCLAHPDSLREIIGKYTKLSSDELQKISLPTFSFETDKVDLQGLIDRMQKRNMLSRKVSAEEMIHLYNK